MKTPPILKDFQNNNNCNNNEVENLEPLDPYARVPNFSKERERVFDSLWSLEEQQTILGLLKSKKKRKNDENSK